MPAVLPTLCSPAPSALYTFSQASDRGRQRRMLSPQSRMYAKIECIWTRFLDTPLSRTRQAHVVLPPSRLDGASRTLAVGRRDT